MNLLAAVLLTGLATARPPAGPAIRLAPFQCAGTSDVELRPLLKVELRDRMFEESGPAPADFLLVSIACEGNTASILSVPQAAGSPARRRVQLEGVDPAARPRNLAVAVAELLGAAPRVQGEVASEPAPPPAPSAIAVRQMVGADENPAEDAAALAPLDLVEPLILMPLTATRRAGVRPRIGSTYVPQPIPGSMSNAPNYYVFSLETFLELPVGRSVVASFSVPVTGTDGPGVSSWGQLANLTAALRYASGGRLRVGLGAALSLNIGDPTEALAMANLFELDRYRDGTESLRLQADALWRPGRLYFQGEVATILLADAHVLGSVFRSGVSAGINLSRATIGAEYLMAVDVSDHYFPFGKRLIQSLIVGTRWKATETATLGVHLYLAIDQGPNAGVGATFSGTWTF